MLKEDRRAWLIVAVLFAIGAFIFGGTISTPGVFFAPLIKEFGWSHARVSSLASAITLGTIPGSIAAGFLLERIDARIPITSGATLTSASLLFASQANSYFPLLLSCFFAGLGVGMATLLPISLVIANWFREKRGIAMGVAVAGISAGGMVMVQLAAAAIRAGGWRAGYVALALPILLIAVPLTVVVVRTRPPDPLGGVIKQPKEVLSNPPELEGFSLAEAIRIRSFWLIAAATFLFAFTVYGILTQLVVYLIGIGYQPSTAAIVLGLMLGLNAAGKVIFGIAADRVGARLPMAVSFGIIAGGIVLLLCSRTGFLLASFLAVYGPAWGAPLALIPLLTMESLGLKHYGSLGGILRIAEATGAVLGPLTLGQIFDLTNTYGPAFGLSILCAIVGIFTTLGCENFTSAAIVAGEIVPRAEVIRG
jgi:MFS family permease